MKWAEVRNLYPNQFVKFEILHSMVEKDKEIVDEVAVIGPVADENATKELLNSKNNVLIYHTSKENVVLEIRTRSVLRRSH
ncbi:hypothetical protein [Caldalkalibacillus mannanilyticus]|uniref:hypothetical protein n=1 Tax=Caldalkalibacillus mannanilyticus TaxID=1418 RepID=UPI00046933F5|nr:hypothetical protein [Caldalkalibacillus mannanilyticus]